MILLVNYVIANLSWNLMMDNMAGIKFKALAQWEVLILLVPLVAYHGLGISAESEIVLTKVVTGVALCLYMSRLLLISIQWCNYANI